MRRRLLSDRPLMSVAFYEDHNFRVLFYLRTAYGMQMLRQLYAKEQPRHGWENWNHFIEVASNRKISR